MRVAMRARTSAGRSSLSSRVGDRLRDDRRRQLVVRRQQPVAHRHRPFAARAVLLVELAVHARTLRIRPVVQLFLDRVFENLALFLDDQNLFEPVRECVRALRFERPHAADLVQHGCRCARRFRRRDRDRRAPDARRDRPCPPVMMPKRACRRIDLDAVQLVRAHVGERGVPLVVEQTRFLHERRIGPADVQAAFGHREIGRHDDFRAMRIDIDRRRRFDHVGHAFHRDPQAGVAAHRPAVQAEVEIFLHVRRKQHRQAARLEDVLGLMRERRRFRGVIVAGEHQHAAVRRRAGGIAVLEDVAGTVDARAFAVPHREHAVVLGARVQVDLLRAPDGGGGEVFVDARLEHDAVRGEMLLRLPQRLVETAERRTAIAGDEAGGVEPGGLVAFLLQHRQAHQRLDAAHVRAAAFERVFVVERDGFQRGF